MLSKETRAGINKEILERISKGDFIASAFAKEAGLTPTSVNRYLAQMQEEGVLKKTKVGRKNAYELIDTEKSVTFPINGRLDEDVIWKKEADGFFSELTDTARKNLGYAFSEILNNAIDHSGGRSVKILLRKSAYQSEAIIIDDGIGIFNKIAASLNLEEKSFAILELAKGKFTTDPDSHTGEGVFFSSKAVDGFAIISGGLIFTGFSDGLPPIIDDLDLDIHGTAVYLAIHNDHSETLEALFSRFTDYPDGYGFSKTIVPVRLLEYGDEKPLVVSRSQARRLMTRFDRFKNIILDFAGIDSIGQGFADEIFRVFAKRNPETKIIAIHCSDSVDKMIRWVSEG